MKALDLFCGLGGWSDGLALEGFEVLGVEIEQHIADLYKHPVIVADIRALDSKDFQGYNLIVGSPPCRDFSPLGTMFGHLWKEPPDPQRGLELVLAFLRIIKEANPQYWLMENVPGLTKHIQINPRCTAAIGETMKRCFWGNFPAFLVPRDMTKGKFYSISDSRTRKNGSPSVRTMPEYTGPLRSWKKAKIPLPVARALGRAVRNELERTV